jgi:hypothetical protein
MSEAYLDVDSPQILLFHVFGDVEPHISNQGFIGVVCYNYLQENVVNLKPQSPGG